MTTNEVGTHQLETLDERIDQLAQRLDALDDALLLGAVSSSTKPRPNIEPVYTTVEQWVAEYFAPTFGRPLGGEFRWCIRWEDHAEALIRLESLWRSWEHLRLDPALGMATWLRDHLDHQLPILLGARGPFARCSIDRHEPPRALQGS